MASVIEGDAEKALDAISCADKAATMNLWAGGVVVPINEWQALCDALWLLGFDLGRDWSPKRTSNAWHELMVEEGMEDLDE